MAGKGNHLIPDDAAGTAEIAGDGTLRVITQAAAPARPYSTDSYLNALGRAFQAIYGAYAYGLFTFSPPVEREHAT